MQFDTGSLTNAAVAVAVTAAEEGPSNRINVVPTVLWTLTAIAGALEAPRVTPGTLVGKLTDMVSAAVPPKPLSRA